MGNPINTGPGNNINNGVLFNPSFYEPPCPPGVFVVNSSSIGFSGSGSTCDPISAFVLISQVAGNSLQIFADGLYASGGTGGGTPGGTNTNIQFNNSGIFAGSSNLIWNGSSVIVTTPSVVQTVYPAFVAQNNGAATSGHPQYGGFYYSNGSSFLVSSLPSSLRWGNEPTINQSTQANVWVIQGSTNGGPYTTFVSISDFNGGTWAMGNISLVAAGGGGQGSIASGLGLFNNILVQNNITFGVGGTSAVPSLQFAAGVLLTSIANQAIEVTSNHIYYSANGVRYQLDQQTGLFLSGVTNPIVDAAGILSLAISPTAGNSLQILANGLYASGGTGGSTNISSVYGNRIRALMDGIYTSGSTGYFNVKDYGLLDDNSTDNSALLINLINNIVPVYGGTVYFPGGGQGYLFKSTITINKNIIIRGDGKQAYAFYTENSTPNKGASNLYFSASGTTFISFVSNPGTNAYITFAIKDISIVNTSIVMPSSGSNGILIDNVTQHFTFDNVCVQGFYTNIYLSSAEFGLIDNCDILAPIKYGIVLDNHINHDVGVIYVKATNIISGFLSGSTAVGAYIKGGGGSYFEGCWFNAQLIGVTQSTQFVYGIFSDFASGPTSDFHITNCFFENFQVSAIKLTTITSSIYNLSITNCEIAPENLPGTMLAAIDITNFINVQIDNIHAANSGGGVTSPVVNLTSCSNVYIGAITTGAYTSTYAITSCTNVSFPLLVNQANSTAANISIIRNADNVSAGGMAYLQCQGANASMIIGQFNGGATPFGGGFMIAGASFIYSNAGPMCIYANNASGTISIGAGSNPPVPQLLVNINGIILAGSLAYNYTEVSATYTIAVTDCVINATSGTFNITIPTATTSKGRVYTIKNTGTGIITLLTSYPQETIDGLSSYKLSQNQWITIVSDGHFTCWQIVNKSTPFIRTILSSYSILTTDNTILVDCTASGITATLPAASVAGGTIFNIKKIDSSVNAVTIATISGNIDGASTKNISIQYNSLSMVSDGSTYYII